MKIVLDTNVLVSGIFWKGVPGKILDYWVSDKIEFAATEDILNEYMEVIQRFSSKDEQTARYWTIFLQENIEIIISDFDQKICRDPDDDKFINCALSSSSNYIVSGDKDLLALENLDGICVTTPTNFLKILKDIYKEDDKK